MYPASSDSRLPGLDTLRATAIILVFLYHYQGFVAQHSTFGIVGDLGWAGVDLFFVLSGFLIGDQLLSGLAADRQLSLSGFYGRRFLRTLPTYLVVLTCYFMFPAFMGGNPPPPLWRFLTFTQNFGLKPGTAFSHAWSLSIEEQFYLILPLLALLFTAFGKKRGAAWAVLAAMVAVATWARYLGWRELRPTGSGGFGVFYSQVYYASVCRFDEFLPGIALALLKNFHPTIWKRVEPTATSYLRADC